MFDPPSAAEESVGSDGATRRGSTWAFGGGRPLRSQEAKRRPFPQPALSFLAGVLKHSSEVALGVLEQPEPSEAFRESEADIDLRRLKAQDVSPDRDGLQHVPRLGEATGCTLVQPGRMRTIPAPFRGASEPQQASGIELLVAQLLPALTHWLYAMDWTMRQ